MVFSTLLGFVYPQPSNLFVSAMSVVSLVTLGNAGLSEFKGKHMKYSKFWNFGVDRKDPADRKAKISGKTGMIVAYTPAFLAGIGSFILLPSGDLRLDLLRLAITFHFFKRICEEVEKIVPVRFPEEKNSRGETPEETFTREHENVQKDGEKWMKAHKVSAWWGQH